MRTEPASHAHLRRDYRRWDDAYNALRDAQDAVAQLRLRGSEMPVPDLLRMELKVERLKAKLDEHDPELVTEFGARLEAARMLRQAEAMDTAPRKSRRITNDERDRRREVRIANAEQDIARLVAERDAAVAERDGLNMDARTKTEQFKAGRRYGALSTRIHNIDKMLPQLRKKVERGRKTAERPKPPEPDALGAQLLRQEAAALLKGLPGKIQLTRPYHKRGAAAVPVGLPYEYDPKSGFLYRLPEMYPVTAATVMFEGTRYSRLAVIAKLLKVHSVKLKNPALPATLSNLHLSA